MIEQLLVWEAVQLTLAAMIHAMHDPLHIFRAAEILRQAIVFAGLTALISSIISSISVIVVTHSFTRYLKSIAKPAILLMACLIAAGASGCINEHDRDWHHRHPHWRDDGTAEPNAPEPIKAAAIDAPDINKPATPEVAVQLSEHFGGITVMSELRELKRHVTELANRPVVCLCDCGRRPWGAGGKGPTPNPSPGPVPVMIWRVDPLNPGQLQYGYELGGFFYVVSTAAKPVGFEPSK
jgi:hypothetical protein